MPVERQARAPFTRRDKRLLAAVACAAAAAAIALGVTLATRADRPGGAGCVDVVLPSTMGGAALRRCGAAGRSFCRAEGSRAAAIAAACRRAGFAEDLSSGP
jgi:hypothetical protein